MRRQSGGYRLQARRQSSTGSDRRQHGSRRGGGGGTRCRGSGRLRGRLPLQRRALRRRRGIIRRGVSLQCLDHLSHPRADRTQRFLRRRIRLCSRRRHAQSRRRRHSGCGDGRGGGGGGGSGRGILLSGRSGRQRRCTLSHRGSDRSSNRSSDHSGFEFNRHRDDDGFPLYGPLGTGHRSGFSDLCYA